MKNTLGLAVFLFTALIVTGCSVFSEKDKAKLEKDRIYQQAMAAQAAQDRQLDTDIKPDHLKLAKDLVDSGLYDIALVQLTEVRKHDPDNPEIYYLLGKCARENKNYPEAESSFKKAIQINPEFAPAYNGLGLLYDMTSKREKARQQYQIAIRLNPARADFYNNLGFSEIIEGNYKDAQQHLLKSIVLNPDFKKAKNNLAFCYVMTGRNQKALEILQQNFADHTALHNLRIMRQAKGTGQTTGTRYYLDLEGPKLLLTP